MTSYLNNLYNYIDSHVIAEGEKGQSFFCTMERLSSRCLHFFAFFAFLFFNARIHIYLSLSAKIFENFKQRF